MTSAGSSAELKPPETQPSLSHSPEHLQGTWPALIETKSRASAHGRMSPENLEPRRTKVILSIGPGMQTVGVLRSLLEMDVSGFCLSGVNVGREFALKAVYSIRSISAELNRPVCLVLAATESVGPAGDWAEIRFAIEAGADWIAIPSMEHGRDLPELHRFLVDARRGSVGVLATLPGDCYPPDLNRLVRCAEGVISCTRPLRPEAIDNNPGESVPPPLQAGQLTVRRVDSVSGLLDALSSRPDAVWLTEPLLDADNLLGSFSAHDRLIRQFEAEDRTHPPIATAAVTPTAQVIRAAIQHVEQEGATALVLQTRSRTIATICSAFRLRGARTIVFTPDTRLARKLRAFHCLESFVIPGTGTGQQGWRLVEKSLRELRLVPRGTKVVFLADAPDAESETPEADVRALS